MSSAMLVLAQTVGGGSEGGGHEALLYVLALLMGYVLAMVGALALQVFVSQSERSLTARPFLERWFADRDEQFYFRADVMVNVCFGPLLAVLIYMPFTTDVLRDVRGSSLAYATVQALICGVSWAAAVSWLVGHGSGSAATPQGATSVASDAPPSLPSPPPGAPAVAEEGVGATHG